MTTALDDRLTNWGRAMCPGQATRTCGSIEGQYRSPQRNHWELVPNAPRPWVDQQDAAIVETAWGSLILLQRIMLRGHYCDKWIPPRICRIAARLTRQPVKASDFDSYLTDAQCGIALALRRAPEVNRDILRFRTKIMLDTSTKILYMLPQTI